ncbi:MAG TPA: manganese efflux pump [Chloroflexota bacterium]|jgi:putative Mn2+ efflux pump MntP|nr:manganese efflux pump [Chloroflexota bacterium]
MARVMIGHLLILAAIILPLGMDTLLVSATLGIAGIPDDLRLRTSMVLAAFEGGMPVLGFLIGGGIGHIVGRNADWAAAGLLGVVGLLMLRPNDESEEAARVRTLARARGIAVIGLGLAISVDELAIGFSLGLLGLSLPVAVVWIGIQAFAFAQVGLRAGSRISEAFQEIGERLAGITLILIALLLAVLSLRGGV